MYAIPVIHTMSYATGGTIDLSGVAVFLAWTLIAAFVGCILGLLREYTRPAAVTAHTKRATPMLHLNPLRTHHAHSEAA